jgi:hypothetical protein
LNKNYQSAKWRRGQRDGLITPKVKRFQNKNEIEEHIFSIVSHLNIGKSQMDKQQLLNLNLIATEKSLHNW